MKCHKRPVPLPGRSVVRAPPTRSFQYDASSAESVPGIPKLKNSAGQAWRHREWRKFFNQKMRCPMSDVLEVISILNEVIFSVIQLFKSLKHGRE